MAKIQKAQMGKIVKAGAKIVSAGAKAADKASDMKKALSKAKQSMNASKELSVYQKERMAKGKPVYRGSNPKGNMTMKEIQAKKDLQKAVQNRKKAKPLTKEQQYQKAIEDSYRKTGGAVKSKKG